MRRSLSQKYKITEGPKIESYLKENDLQLIKIFITHGHLDHAGGDVFNLSKKFNVPIEGPHKEDEFLISAFRRTPKEKCINLLNSRTFRFKKLLPDRWLDDGDQLELDGIHFFHVYHCIIAGHTPGHYSNFSTIKNLNLPS